MHETSLSKRNVSVQVAGDEGAKGYTTTRKKPARFPHPLAFDTVIVADSSSVF